MNHDSVTWKDYIVRDDAHGPAAPRARRRVVSVPLPYIPYQPQTHLIGTLLDNLDASLSEPGRVCVVESPTGTGKTLSLLSATVAWLSDRLGESLAAAVGRHGGPPSAALSVPPWRLLYASRTHSQVAQVADTLANMPQVAKGPRRQSLNHLPSAHHQPVAEDHHTTTELRSAESSPQGVSADVAAPPRIRFVHVASRLHLCINDALKRRAGSSAQRLNELCREAVAVTRKRGSAVRGADFEDLASRDSNEAAACAGCPFSEKAAIKRLVDYLIIAPRTMEELHALGRAHGGCPFFAMRRAARWSHVLLLPYPYLLDGGMLDALLKGGSDDSDDDGDEDDASDLDSTIRDRRRSLQKKRRRAASRKGAVGGVDSSHWSSSSSSSDERETKAASSRAPKRQGYGSHTTEKQQHSLYRFRPPALLAESTDGRDNPVAAQGAEDATEPSADVDESTRPIVGQQTIIVIDEAHNIGAAAASAATASLASNQCGQLLGAVRCYELLYASRLLLSNRQQLRQLGMVLSAIQSFLSCVDRSDALREHKDKKEQEHVMSLTTFLFRAGLDNVNFFTLVDLLSPPAAAHGGEHSLIRRIAGVFDGAVGHYRRKRLDAEAGVVSCGKGKDRTAPRPHGQAGPDDNEVETICAVSSNNVPHPFAFAYSGLTQLETLCRLLAEADEHNLVISVDSVQQTVGEGGAPEACVDPPSSSERQLTVALASPYPVTEGLTSRARCTILAGGTMKPFDVLQRHLFPDYSWSNGGCRAEAFAPAGGSRSLDLPLSMSCSSFGHVVASNQFLVLGMSSGPSIPHLRFTHETRDAWPEMLADVGCAIVNMCRIVPAGMVAFLPSYRMMALFVGVLQQRATGGGAATSLWEQISASKVIFVEQQGGDTDDLLRRYSAAALRRTETGPRVPDEKAAAGGALLLSVIGGKLSEGINFSDDLGRCVVVIGMPYPNPHDPVLRARMAKLDGVLPGGGDGTAGRCSPAATGSSSDEGSLGTRYYGALCSTAVNQCVGRCLRHSGDYAAIVLVDARYKDFIAKGQRSQLLGREGGSGLPAWMTPDGEASRVLLPTGFGQLFKELAAFFRGRVSVR